MCVYACVLWMNIGRTAPTECKPNVSYTINWIELKRTDRTPWNDPKNAKQKHVSISPKHRPNAREPFGCVVLCCVRVYGFLCHSLFDLHFNYILNSNSVDEIGACEWDNSMQRYRCRYYFVCKPASQPASMCLHKCDTVKCCRCRCLYQ